MTVSSTRSLGRDRRRKGDVPVREPGAEPVVAHDEVVLREILVEAARARMIPLLLEMRHPLRTEDHWRPLADGCEAMRRPSRVQKRMS
jgi:hypothetical protein